MCSSTGTRLRWPLPSEISGCSWATLEEATIYTEATGHQLDEVAVNFFRLTWDLADIAAFTDLLRSPHDHSEDTVKAYDALMHYLTTRDRWAELLE